MIDREHDLPITKQAKVLRISRGSVYYLPRPVSATDLEVMRRLDRLHRIERLYSHPPHQRFDMTTADLAPLQSQQASQHTRTGEGILQVQPIELPHDLEVG